MSAMPHVPAAPPELLQRFADIPTPHLSDNLQRLGGVVGLHRLHRSRKLLGSALTLKTRPGDNQMIYRMLTLIEPGHVLVVDGGGDVTNALVGELIMLYAQQRGCAGFVLDGAARDAGAFHQADFPCYARGVTHRGPYKQGPAWMNVPVSIGGQVIQPGDILVGDEDGIVSFPASEAENLWRAARKTAEIEEAIKAEIASGSTRQSWLERVLAAGGV